MATKPGTSERCQVSRAVRFARRDIEPGEGGNSSSMLFDIIVAIIIVAIAAVLGLVVHPILWVIVIAAVLWLFGRRRYSRR